MLRDVIRKVIPIKYRQDIGLWTIYQAGKSKLLLYPYLFMLCGDIPRGLKLIPNQEGEVSFRGYDILFPRDGVLAAMEVLQDEIYEKYYSPQNGDTVIDVGAYVGMFTVKASLQVGKKGRVIAIEPASSNIRYLVRNTSSFENVIVVPLAAGSSSGDGNLTLSWATPCHTLIPHSGNRTETIKIDTLDNIVSNLRIEKVEFIKIDAEGWELEILKGASKILKDNKLRLAVASYHNLPTGEYELPQVCQLLTSAGFKIKVVKGYVYAKN